jgi:hypothetical protein
VRSSVPLTLSFPFSGQENRHINVASFEMTTNRRLPDVMNLHSVKNVELKIQRKT